jgi:PAS domain S-box-containing protein
MGDVQRRSFDDQAAMFAATMAALRDPLLVMSAVRGEDGAIVDLRYEYLNDSAAANMAVAPSELIGELLLERYPSHLENGLFEAYCAVIESGEPRIIEVPWFDEGGIVGAWEVSLNPLSDGFVASTRDVTERVLHLAEIERRETMYRLLADHAADVIMLSKDRRVEWVSPSVARVLGWTPEELHGWSTDELVHPDDRPGLVVLRNEATREVARRLRARIRSVDGSWRWYDIIARRVDAGEDGASVRGVSVLIDVQNEVDALDALARGAREREELEHHLQHTQRLESLGLLAGGIAHDYNNMLTAIRGHAGLARDFGPSAQIDSHLERIEAVVERASELSAQLLDYAGRNELRLEPIELDQVVNRTDLLLDLWWPAEVDLRVEVAPGVVVLADRTRLRQVVVNLIRNAAQACSAPGGVVAVGVDRDPHAAVAVLTVSDTGTGIAPDVVERIFDPFFTTKSGGRGLGLSVVHGIVESLGGSIRVRSSLGVGTTFTVELPLAPASAP